MHKNYLKTIDNVFELEYQQYLYNVCKNASFKIGWNDNILVDLLQRVYFYHRFEDIVYKDTLLESKIRSTEFGEVLKNHKIGNAVINCARPGETYYHHAHDQDEMVVLYYPNTRWQKEWGGETMFYDSKSNELIYASEYKSNRILLFDGTIPHCVRPPTYISDQFRFTIATFFIPK